MMNRGHFSIKGDALLLHAEMRLIPCGVDNARKFEPVSRPECENLITNRRVNLYRFPVTISPQRLRAGSPSTARLRQPAAMRCGRLPSFLTASAVVFPPSPIGNTDPVYRMAGCCSKGVI